MRPPGAAGFAVEHRADGPVIHASTARLLAPSSRRLAWFVVVAGITGLAGLAVLRAPAAVDAVYLAFWLAAAGLVWADTRDGGLRFDGEIRVDVRSGRLERLAGFGGLAWSDLRLPPRAALVIRSVPGVDTRRLIAGQARPVRLAAVPITGAGEEALWAAALDGALPGGVEIVDSAAYDVGRGLAEALAQALEWPVFDLASAEPERRAPQDLDRPLYARLAALGQASDPAPAARPWGAASWGDAAGAQVRLRTFGLAGLIAQMALAVPMLALLYLFSGGNLAIPLLGAALLTLAAGGRTHLDLTPHRIAIRPLSAWMPLDREQILAWEQVEQLHVVAERGVVGLRFATDAGTVFVPAPSRAAARWAAAEIRRYLREHAPVARIDEAPAPGGSLGPSAG